MGISRLFGQINNLLRRRAGAGFPLHQGVNQVIQIALIHCLQMFAQGAFHRHGQFQPGAFAPALRAPSAAASASVLLFPENE